MTTEEKEKKNRLEEKRTALKNSLAFILIMGFVLFSVSCVFLELLTKSVWITKGEVLVLLNSIAVIIFFVAAFIITVGYYIGSGEPNLDSRVIWIWIFGISPAIGLFFGWQAMLFGIIAYCLGVLASYGLLRLRDSEVRMTGLFS